MCFHYALSKISIERKNRYIRKDKPFTPIFHASGYAFPQMPVITSEQSNEMMLYHWGLIPWWTKDSAAASEIRKHTLNAKSETVFEKPSFAKAIKSQRCLVLASGFYEWQEYNGKKYPYYITLKGKDDFAFAGIYDMWADKETGEVINTYSILTTEANPLMAKIHNTKKRMPVILTPNIEMDWLGASLTKSDVAELTKPISSGALTAYTISKLITSRTQSSNVPQVQELFTYPELSF